jgi:hypothetical protein
VLCSSSRRIRGDKIPQGNGDKSSPFVLACLDLVTGRVAVARDHIQAHSNQLGASNPTAVPCNVLAPRPMHSGHSIYQWLPNHGLHRVHHKHSESPDRTCECRQLSRYPTLSLADLKSLGLSFYSIMPVGEQPTTCPAQKVFLRHL